MDMSPSNTCQNVEEKRGDGCNFALSSLSHIYHFTDVSISIIIISFDRILIMFSI